MEHKLSPETSLKNLRATRSLSQSEVAEVIGTNANTISRWERGVTTPSLYYRRKLAQFFEVDPQMLASDVTNKDDETVSHPSYIQTELAPLSTEGAPNAVLDQNINLSRKIEYFIIKSKLYSEQRQNRRIWAIMTIILLLVTILVILIIPINFSSPVANAVSSSSDSLPIGLCDGRCALDVDRLNGPLKRLAANELQQQHHNAACAYLDWARKEDQTDAEAKINYENQCGSNNGESLHCPCINYVATVMLAKEQPIIDRGDTLNTDSAIYSNGMSRSILQAVYLQQKSWNQSHKNGPPMYIFVANVGDVSDIQHASQWQEQVAQQIISLQQTGGEHHINGVVGLPQGTNTLMDLLNQNAIPMISIASLSENNSTNQQYLLSVAPSIETEMSAAVQFLSHDIMKDKKPIHVGVFSYKSKDPYEQIVSTFKSMLPSGNKSDDQLYDSLPQNTSLDVEHLAEQAAGTYDAIFFAGPVNDLLTFITTLRKTDATTPVLATNITYQSVYYYHPPLVKKSLQKLYFTAFAYHDTERYSGLLQRSPMISEFGQTYDPQSVHSGDIYTYQLPSSDAILAYNAIGVFTHLMNHYGVEHLPDWQSQRAFLANNPPTLTGGIVTFMKTSNTLQVKTVLLLQIGSGGISYLDKKV